MPIRYELLGHDGPPTGLWDENLITGQKLTLCPIRVFQLAPEELRAEIQRWKYTYYPLYQKGHLLVPGGIADQPNRWLEAMAYLEDLDALKEDRYREIKFPDSGGAKDD